MAEFIKGKGAQINPNNRFEKLKLSTADMDGLDEPLLDKKPPVQVFEEQAKKILSPYDSPDLGKGYSINAYQGCEHGCTYCYARVSHQYWGFGAGLDFESKIMVKRNAPKLLDKELGKSTWTPQPIMMSGNTDCYQPIERKYQLTRKLLEVLWAYRNPVGIITKNTLLERDMDLFAPMAEKGLIRIMFSINTLNEQLRRFMEPRTANAEKKLRLISKLSSLGAQVGVMVAPVVPGLNDHELPAILKAAKEAGAATAGYATVRLNGEIGEIFTDWLAKTYPDRKNKVLNQIRAMHGGQLNDSQFGRRMRGEGVEAMALNQVFRIHKAKYFSNPLPKLETRHFRRSKMPGLFD